MNDNEEKKINSIKSWSIDDRPREKMILKGATALSNAELIAILFGNGTRKKSAVDLARELLDTVSGDLNTLSNKSIKDLQKINGVGPAKAVTLMAALELFKRKENTVSVNPKIHESKDAYLIAKSYLEGLQVEHFLVIYMSRNNKVIHKEIISVGGTSATVVDPKIVFKIALEHLANGIIIAHNHPSGSLSPSQSDIKLTQKIKDGGRLLDIELFDHIIIGSDGYFSFADDGIL